ncbi:copper resistance protein B [Ralstonia sp. GP95]|uniref:copper resistance protein B n=1 Tax=Ralstonia sp. GP95 TaxID=3379822 RepID=UPI003892729C
MTTHKHVKTALAVALALVSISAASAQESTATYDTMAPSSGADTQPAARGSMQGMDHGSMQGMDQGSMQGMDHGSMQGMDQGSMQGMDHGSMQGMDQGSMQGMDHGSMQGMDQGSMQGMDQGSMQGMDQGSMQGMDHGSMQGMDHGSMQGMTMARCKCKAARRHLMHGIRMHTRVDINWVLARYALSNTRQLMMADEHNFGSFLIDRLEWVRGPNSNAASYEAQAWYGSTYNKVVLKAEGDVKKGRLEEARTELLWWGTRSRRSGTPSLGSETTSARGVQRGQPAAFGVQGLAPYWFNIQATAYVGNSGRTALRLSTEYELLLTQRLILQPRVEANLDGKNDPVLEIGSGLSSASVGLRLRYEFSRQFAPYIGVERYQTFGNTANMIRADGGRSGETRFVAGLRVWY